MDTARTTATTPTQANNAATAAGAQGTTSQSSAMHTSPLYAGAPAVRLDSGGGEPLLPSVQRALESSFQADMGMVRVHSDARSTAVADSLAARAFSYGPNIYLGSGERASDLSLMAHEGAHVVQQQGGGSNVMQMSSSTPAADPFEQEARRASVAVQQGESFTVTGRTAAPRVQKEDVPWYKRGLRAVASGVQAVASVATAGKDLLLGKAAAWAKKIPGYDLLTVVLGKDPITDKPVERNAVNLLRGIAGLIPGGAEMFDNLQKSGALQKAFDWFGKEIDKLNLTWEMIKGLFRQFWDSLSASDILDPSGVFARIGALFGPPLKRLLDFALAAGTKILELIFEGALSLAGAFGKQVLALLQKGANAFSLIFKDPLGFLRNLLLAVKGGFQNFSNNIVKHLKTALFEWLFGALQGAGLTLPDKFDLRGIISIILQVLGLTYTRLREKLVKLIGEPAVAFIEKAFEFLKIIVTQGIAAAWQKLLEFATGLVDTVVEGIRNWVITTIVKAAIAKLVTMFNPVGAIIQGIITIYNTISFFIERAKQIAALANAIFDSIINIANGNLGAAIDYVEKTMARILPVIIGFLASLIGLGGISGQIKKIIEKIQAVVSNAIDKVVNFILDKVKGLIAKMTGKDKKAEDKDQAKPGDVREQARKMLMQKLTGEETRPQIEVVLKNVLTQLQPLGLKRLELGPQGGETESAVLAEASPLQEILDYLTATKKTAYVQMITKLQLRGDQPSFEGVPNIPGTREPVFTAMPGQEKQLRATRLAPVEGKTVVGGLLAVPAEKEVVVGTWNTADEPTKTNNSTHAEVQFKAWLAKQPEPWRKRVKSILIIINYSPCTLCAKTLLEISELLPDLEARPQITYGKVYRHKKIGTTQAELDMLGSKWEIEAREKV